MKDSPVQLSKFLSYVLRHAPEAAGLSLDREGWCDVDALIAAVAGNGFTVDRAVLGRLVETSDKKRFTLSADGARIRAAQGHSTPDVDISFVAASPPLVLFHGTAKDRLASILERGLEPRGRHYVHLSPDEATATRVGRRHGEPVVLRVDSFRMHRAGLEFHRAENDVWLTHAVPAQYLDTI